MPTRVYFFESTKRHACVIACFACLACSCALLTWLAYVLGVLHKNGVLGVLQKMVSLPFFENWKKALIWRKNALIVVIYG